MRRVWRIILNALTIGSLLLGLAFIGLWVRGYWRQDVLGYAAPARADADRVYFQVVSGGGGVAVYVGFHSPAYARQSRAKRWRADSYSLSPVPYAGGWPAGRLGMDYDSWVRPDVRWSGVVFPAWAATILFAMIPLARGTSVVRRRGRKRDGHCKSCGYDLRATPDRCPECGHVPGL